MKSIAWIYLCVALWGEDTQPPAVEEEPKTAQDQNTSGAAAGLSNPLEQWVKGSLDAGYRWRAGLGGNENVYRSIVDLGEGPKLLGADFSVVDPKRRLFDQIDVRASNWGDDPYTTLSATARKSRVYEFTATYRNLAYFNDIPSFANPLLDRGVLSSARAYDVRNRISSFELSLRPGSWLIPYFAYDRSSSYGNGVTTFVSDQNEYPLPFTSNFSDNNMRGGVRIELSRFHVTLEQGGTTFRDDEALLQSSGIHTGTRSTPYLGTTLVLDTLSQAQGVRGDSVYTKVLGTAQPTAWLSLYGTYLYARPRNETRYQQFNTGQFVSQAQALLFTSQQVLLNSAANVPHQSGEAGAEIRLHRRLRFIGNWLTDRIQVSGSNAGLNLVSGGRALQIKTADATGLENDYSQAEGDLLWDVTSHLTLRGGYRYEWGRTSNFVMPPAGLVSQDASAFRRNVAKAGFRFTAGAKFSVTGEAEAAGTGAAYYRTSLYRYQKGRIQGSYQANSQLTFSAAFSGFGNRNSANSVDLSYLGLQTSASVIWNPAGQKHVSFQGTYTRSTVRSDVSFLIPQTLTQDRSHYRDNAHSVQGLFELALPRLGKQATFSAGGSFLISSGTRPTNYFQPVGKLAIPISHGISWFSEWTYYGYGESFYSFEGFRTHLVTSGIKITL